MLSMAGVVLVPYLVVAGIVAVVGLINLFSGIQGLRDHGQSIYWYDLSREEVSSGRRLLCGALIWPLLAVVWVRTAREIIAEDEERRP